MSHHLISIRVHGIFDYIFGAVVFVLPWILGLGPDGSGNWTAIGCGAAVLFYSAITSYERGLLRVLSFDTHLLLDRLVGIILIAGPWLFGFAARTWIPFVILGAAALIVSVLTDTECEDAEPARTQPPRRGRATYTCSEEQVDEEIQSYEQFKHRKEAERES